MVIFQIFPDFCGGGVHPTLHIGYFIEFPVVEHTLVVYQSAGVLAAEEIRHGQNVFPSVGFIAAGPEQDRRVVFVPLEHGFRPVHHAVLPLGQAAGDVPAGFDGSQLLPGAVAFQIGLVHQVDALLIAQVVPGCLVGVVTGADGVDVVPAEGVHGPLHVLYADGPTGARVPLMAVHPPDYQALSVEEHQAVFQFKAAETDVIGNDLQNIPGSGNQGQDCVIEIRCFMTPAMNIGEGKFRAYVVLSVKGQRYILIHQAINGTVDGYIFCVSAEQQTKLQLSCGVILHEGSLKP